MMIFKDTNKNTRELIKNFSSKIEIQKIQQKREKIKIK